MASPPALLRRGRRHATRCEVYVARRGSLRPHHLTLLDRHERARHQRLRQPDDRERFALAAVLLRVIVGLRTGMDPAAVAVDRRCLRCGAPHGRPRVEGTDLQASIAHSADVVAVAVARSGPVGVDVEALAPLDHRELVASTCTPAERPHVRGATDFYAYWTRKEAVLKATGDGLGRAMTEVEVTPPDTLPSLIALGDVPPPPCRLADLPVGDGYAGAVAAITAEPVAFWRMDGDGVLDEGRRSAPPRRLAAAP